MTTFWAVVMGAIWYAVTHTRRAEPRVRERSPEQILDDRSVRGEIDADDYTTRRDALRGASHDRT